MHFPGIRLAPLALLLAACGAPSGGGSADDAERTGETHLAITVVPSTVQCVQITATGSSTVTSPFTVTPGTSSVGLTLGQLPLGSVAISGQAYGATCDSIAGTSPIYVADPQTMTIQAGVVANLTMTFRPDNPVSVTANFVGNVVDIATTTAATFFVMSDGTVSATGQLELANSPVPVPVPGLSNVLQAAGGGGGGNPPFWCAVLTTGMVQCWGENDLGQLGNGTSVNSISAPVTVTGISTAVQIVAGSVFACALLSSGSIECWGYNGVGDLGVGTSPVDSSVPVSIGGGFSKLAAGGNSACAIATSGTVYCWGYNAFGQLGTGNTTNAFTLVNVTGLDAVTALAGGGNHFCALRADGTVRCWGYNAAGQLGNGTSTNSLTPVQVPITGVTQIAASASSTCARNGTGLYCWGDDGAGELGDGTGTNSSSPLLVTALTPTPISLIRSSAGSVYFCAQLANRTIDCWGSNFAGQLGNGTTTSAFVPTPVLVQ